MDVAVGVIVAVVFSGRGVEADSVASRSTVGSEAGASIRPRPETRITAKIKKPQNTTSPAAIQRVRLGLVIPLFYTTIAIICGTGPLRRNHSRSKRMFGFALISESGTIMRFFQSLQDQARDAKR